MRRQQEEKLQFEALKSSNEFYWRKQTFFIDLEKLSTGNLNFLIACNRLSASTESLLINEDKSSLFLRDYTKLIKPLMKNSWKRSHLVLENVTCLLFANRNLKASGAFESSNDFNLSTVEKPKTQIIYQQYDEKPWSLFDSQIVIYKRKSRVS